VKKSDLERFRSRLLAELANLTGRTRVPGDDTGERPDEDDAERIEVELSIGEFRSDRIHAIEQALERIEEKTYGRCEECGRFIAKARLEVIPHTPLCLQCASRRETGLGRSA